jgi:hypothetical protein
VTTGESPVDLPRRPLVHIAKLINHCIRLSYFPKPWKEPKMIALPKPGEDPKFSHSPCPVRLLFPMGRFFKKNILKVIQRHVEGRNLPNASQIGFCANYSMTLQCLGLTYHVTLNYNNKMSTSAVFLDIEKVFDTVWHPGLQYKLCKLEFSTKVIKLISSFLSK